MRAVIYARKSTDDNREKSAADKSIATQEQQSRAYAKRKGWKVVEVFADDGISGGEFEKRAGLQSMMAKLVLKPRPFDVVLTVALDRLGRDTIYTPYYIDRITSAGVRIFIVLEDQEVMNETTTDRIILSVRSAGAEEHRIQTSIKTRAALHEKAQAGHSAGGFCYGYKNNPVMGFNALGKPIRTHTLWAVNEAEAKVVRGIFEMYAAGHGFVAIAHTLNGSAEYREPLKQFFKGEAPPSPKQGERGSGSWCPTGIREFLYRRRYRGVLEWGRHGKKRKGGTKKGQRVVAEPDKVVTVLRPDLRIVPEALWERAQHRLKAVRELYKKMNPDRPDTQRVSRFLLTGLCRCGLCGANMVAFSSGPTSRKVYRYTCSHRHNRGICKNDVHIRLDWLEEQVLAAIETTALMPEAVEYVLDRALVLLREEQHKFPEKRILIEKEIEKIRVERKKLVDLFASGTIGWTDEEMEAGIKKRKDRIKELETELASLRSPSGRPSFDERALRKAMRARLGDFRGLLRGDVQEGRQALRELLTAPIRCRPIMHDDGRTGMSFQGETRLGALLPENKGVYKCGTEERT